MDYGHEQTDKELKKLENRISKEYQRAAVDVKKKSKEYMEKFKAKDKIKREQLKNGEITKADYNQWKTGQIMIGKRWEEMRDTLYQDLSNAKEIAKSMTTEFSYDVYALNHNYGTFEVESGSLMNTSYTLYDRDTVYTMIKDKPTLLPNFKESQKDIDKDKRWSLTKMNSAVLQGILQGESMDGIAKRLSDVVGMDEKIAIRNARTMTTAVENLGRQNSYKRAEKMGIKLENQWVATLDSRTRDSHRMLDGETRKVGDQFSNGLEYPGDPNGKDPSEIYNCRCTLIAVVEESKYEEMTDENGVILTKEDALEDISYEDWKYEHVSEVDKYKHLLGEAQYHKGTIPDKTYSGIWQDDVTIADYMSKKNSIQGKRDYYESEIDKYKNDPTYKPWMSESMKNLRVQGYQEYLKDLDEFEKYGKQYEKYQNQINEYQKKIKEIGGSPSVFSSEKYSQERKGAALNFDYRKDADRYLRPIFDKKWDELTEFQKYSVWEYTRNSHPMNQPLSGFNDGWSRYEFVGVGNAKWSLQDNWRHFATEEFTDKFGTDGHKDYMKTISELTKAIDGSSFSDKDMWLVRKSSTEGLAGLIEGDVFSYDDAMQVLKTGDVQMMKDSFVGETFQMHSFTSTGMAHDAHWSGNVSYSIYAPEGTKGIYSEPASYFGDTIDGEERIYKIGDYYNSVGSEAEIILQRGTQYRITDIEYDYGSYHVTMEVVGQPDYFVTGLEETFNGGATLHSN